MSDTKNWILQGSYFETCNCEIACPCVWLQPPTTGDCKLLVAWHIDQGHLDNQVSGWLKCRVGLLLAGNS